jgi:hypothetical protein
VPLIRRHPSLFWERRGDLVSMPRLKLRQFMSERFGLTTAEARTVLNHLAYATAMPSSIIRALAMEIAFGDVARAEQAYRTRSGYRMHIADHEVSQRFGVDRCLISFLWRYGGDPDELWTVLNERMAELAAEGFGGGEK